MPIRRRKKVLHPCGASSVRVPFNLAESKAQPARGSGIQFQVGGSFRKFNSCAGAAFNNNKKRCAPRDAIKRTAPSVRILCGEYCVGRCNRISRWRTFSRDAPYFKRETVSSEARLNGTATPQIIYKDDEFLH